MILRSNVGLFRNVILINMRVLFVRKGFQQKLKLKKQLSLRTRFKSLPLKNMLAKSIMSTANVSNTVEIKGSGCSKAVEQTPGEQSS